MNHNITVMIAEMIHQLRMESLPQEVENIAKTCMLDYLGTTFAGAYDLKPQIDAYLDAMSMEIGNVSVIGCERKTSIYQAALLNGMSAHFHELDDGSRFGMVHLGAPILSALFAVAQCYQITYLAFLKAIVIGYEVTIRLSAAIQPGHKERGFHATGTCGCVGAAVAIAVALGFDSGRMENVLAAAVASSSGLLEMIEGTSQLKPFNAGKAAQNAIAAAFVGNAGFSGPADAIGGKRGLVGAMGDALDEKWLERTGDRHYTIFGIYRKPYASCRHCHSAVEAALKMCRDSGVNWRQIETIQVQTYDLAVFGHDHTDIQGVGSAKMSIPFSVAAAFILNDGGMYAMSEQSVHDERILSLASRVSVFENPDYSALVPKKRIAKLSVIMKDGENFNCEVTYPKGEPENPMSLKELEEKFVQLLHYAGKKDAFCNRVIWNVENLNYGFTELLRQL